MISTHIAFYFLWPTPVEVSHWLESLDSGKAQPTFQAATGTIFQFRIGEFFQQHVRGPSSRRGVSNKIIQVLRDRP
jgi:hypothetical protein